jgi:hypothetical protein
MSVKPPLLRAEIGYWLVVIILVTVFAAAIIMDLVLPDPAPLKSWSNYLYADARK